MNRFLKILLPSVLLSMTTTMTYANEDRPPIVFVHGDSDTAGLWIAQIWRFESNGYPADHFFPVDIPHPSARSDDTKPEANRSSTEDAAKAVAAKVDEALKATGATKVVLVANSRGCQTARNYVKNFGGAVKVSKMVLTGCVHNGVFVAPGVAEGSEYNGAGLFLKTLNAPPVIPDGVTVTILRSDKFDLYSQPDGKFIGNPGKPTGANYNSPELAGADNIVLPGVDHRETAFSITAFQSMYKAITGQAPETTAILPQENPVLTGKVSGFENDAPTNMPLSGATVTIYAVDSATGARQGDPVYEKTVGPDGIWGDFNAAASQAYEFVIKAEGYPLTRIYRSPFPRSYKFVNLRLYPAPVPGGEFVNVMRPRGYFGPDDQALANGKPLPGIAADEPVPHVWKSSVAVTASDAQSIVASFNGETIAAMSSPADSKDVTWIELTY